ncbi:MAG: hypothetical protein Aurels2KO_25290 [Aureliella sp.]
MAEGKRLAEWDHTSQLLCVHAEAGTHPNSLPPYRRKQYDRRDKFTPDDLRRYSKSLAKREK